MNSSEPTSARLAWKGYEKFLFRFFFIYFLLQIFPFDWKFYRELFLINWENLSFGDIFELTRYSPRFFGGLPTYADWALIAVAALMGAGIWTYKDRKSENYLFLYYWLRVLLRYRLAAGLIGYAFIKIFPIQSPYPSLSNLNTNYGDFTAWKIFSMSLGIVPGYESFLGVMELLAAALLLYRKTVTVGSFMVLMFTGNVFLSNLAYEGGEAVYSLYLLSIAAFLIAYDVKRLYNLFGREVPVLPPEFYIHRDNAWYKKVRLGLKNLFLYVFVVLYGYKTRQSFHSDTYPYPSVSGLPDISGVYNVTEFRVNRKVIPYSGIHPYRWKDVVFEKWATMSIRSNRPLIIDSTYREVAVENDEQRNDELSGAGGRHYFAYTADLGAHILSLKNKNKHHSDEMLKLHYERPSNTRIILSGINEKNDSLYVVLDKVNRRYLLEEADRLGRGQNIKL